MKCSGEFTFLSLLIILVEQLHIADADARTIRRLRSRSKKARSRFREVCVPIIAAEVEREEYAGFLPGGTEQKLKIVKAAITRVRKEEPKFGMDCTGRDIIELICYDIIRKVGGLISAEEDNKPPRKHTEKET